MFTLVSRSQTLARRRLSIGAYNLQSISACARGSGYARLGLHHISHLISLKNKAKRKADRTGDPTDSRVSFFRMKNLKDAVRQAKVNYLESLVSKSRRVPGCAAEVWSYVNAMFGHTKSYQSPQQDLGSLNSINDYFQTVAISSDHRCANDFVVPADSSVGADPGICFF